MLGKLFGCKADDMKADVVLIADNKQCSFFEDIVQVGKHADSGIGHEDEELVTQCLREFWYGNEELGVLSFQERNPNFYIFDAVIHRDEPKGTPHIHINGVPFADGYKNGLSRQNSQSRALEAMGFGNHEGSLNEWRIKERGVLEKIINAHGVQKKEEKKARGSFKTAEYGRLIDEVNELVAIEREHLFAELSEDFSEKENELNGKIAELQVKLQDYEDLQVAVDDVDDTGKNMPLGKSVISTSALNIIKEQAKTYRVNKDRFDNIDKLEESVKKREYEAEKAWGNAIDSRNSYNAQKTLLEMERNDVKCEYNKQLNLNACYEKLEEEVVALRKDNYSLKEAQEKAAAQYQADKERTLKVERLQRDVAVQTQKDKYAALSKENDKLKKEIEEKNSIIDNLKEICKGAYQSLANVIMAVKLFKHGKDKYKVDGLTQEQGRLIDSVVDYGVKWANEDGFPDIATDMKSYVGISDGIQEKINARTPRTASRSM